MYTTVKAAITEILQNSGLFEAVYNYEPMSLGSFPAVCVSADSHTATDSVFSDIGRPAQQETYSFKVRLYYGLTQPNTQVANDKQQEAEQIMCELADAVIDLFAQNRSLNGSCDYAQPIGSQFGETERELIVKYCEITLQAVKYRRRV